MRILVISERACIRTLKQIIGLSRNNEVHLLTENIPNIEYCKTATHFFTADHESIRNGIRLYKGQVDLLYIASEPSWLVVLAREVMPDAKIVLDIHDAQIWRTPDPAYQSAEERLSFNWVDGVVVPSESCRKLLDPKSPTLVFPSYAVEDTMPLIPWARKGGIVYEGRVDMPDAWEFMDYSKMEDTAKAFRDAGIPFHMYVPGKDEKKLAELKKIYEGYGVGWHKGKPYEQMVMSMGFHDWGLCGNIKPFREWDVAMPNKLFEYMAGGIPVIALNAKETGQFVEKHKVGISVKSVQEIKKRWDERGECQRNVFLKRHLFTMQANIGTLETFLKGVAAGRPSK